MRRLRCLLENTVEAIHKLTCVHKDWIEIAKGEGPEPHSMEEIEVRGLRIHSGFRVSVIKCAGCGKIKIGCVRRESQVVPIQPEQALGLDETLKVIPIEQELPQVGHHVLLFGATPIIGRRAEEHNGKILYRCCFDGEIIPWEILGWAEINALHHRVFTKLNGGSEFVR